MLINIISNFAQKGEISKCKEYIQYAIDYQVFLWGLGVADTDIGNDLKEQVGDLKMLLAAYRKGLIKERV